MNDASHSLLLLYHGIFFICLHIAFLINWSYPFIKAFDQKKKNKTKVSYHLIYMLLDKAYIIHDFSVKVFNIRE